MSNKIYDVLKWIVMLVMPGCATLYSGLSVIWGLPYGDAIPDTITAVTTFLGAVLMISSSQYNKNATKKV